MSRDETYFRKLIDSLDVVFVGDCRPFDLELHGAADPESGARPDVMLQQRQELAALCAFIEANDVKSFLEIGFWTGRLSAFLREHTCIERVYGADLMLAANEGHALHMPHGSVIFVGDSSSPDFVKWRAEIGHVDMVFIDGDHSFDGCMNDWKNAVNSECRFIGVHDIADHYPYTAEVTDAWREIVEECGGWDEWEVHDLSRPFDELDFGKSIAGIGIVDRNAPQ
jgi:hypothetical protein